MTNCSKRVVGIYAQQTVVVHDVKLPHTVIQHPWSTSLFDKTQAIMCFFLQAERGYGAVCYKQLVASFKELRGIQRPLPHAQSGCDIVILQPD